MGICSSAGQRQYLQAGSVNYSQDSFPVKTRNASSMPSRCKTDPLLVAAVVPHGSCPAQSPRTSCARSSLFVGFWQETAFRRFHPSGNREPVRQQRRGARTSPHQTPGTLQPDEPQTHCEQIRYALAAQNFEDVSSMTRTNGIVNALPLRAGWATLPNEKLGVFKVHWRKDTPSTPCFGEYGPPGDSVATPTIITQPPLGGGIFLFFSGGWASQTLGRSDRITYGLGLETRVLEEARHESLARRS